MLADIIASQSSAALTIQTVNLTVHVFLAGIHAQLPTGPSQEQRAFLAAGGIPPQAIDAVFAEQQARMAELKQVSPNAPVADVQQECPQGPEYWRLVHVDSPEARCSPEEAAVARAAGWDHFTLVPGDPLASVFSSFRQWDLEYCSYWSNVESGLFVSMKVHM